MLEPQLKKLNFYKGVKFETKGKQLLVRSSDRTTLQEKTEELIFKRSNIKFKLRKKNRIRYYWRSQNISI